MTFSDHSAEAAVLVSISSSLSAISFGERLPTDHSLSLSGLGCDLKGGVEAKDKLPGGFISLVHSLGIQMSECFGCLFYLWIIQEETDGSGGLNVKFHSKVGFFFLGKGKKQ